MKGKWKIPALALAVLFAATLAACSAGGGSSSTGGTGGTGGTTTGTTDATVTGVGTGSAIDPTATAVSGTGTQGTDAGIGLGMAEKISVAGSSSQAAPAPKGVKVSDSWFARLFDPSTSTWATTADWFNDPAFVYVQDRSNDALSQPNNILCMIAQTGYKEMTNLGAYIALIDKNKCATKRDNAAEAGQSSSDSNSASNANAPDYEQWTVIANRADASSPTIVSVWLRESMGGDSGKGSGGTTGAVASAKAKSKAKLVSKRQAAMAGFEMQISAKAIIAEEPTATNPYGFFYMNFAGNPVGPDGTVDTTINIMRGFMRTVKVGTGGTQTALQYWNGRDEYFGDPTDPATPKLTLAEASVLNKTATGGEGELAVPDYEAMWANAICDQNGCTPPTTATYSQNRFAYDDAFFIRDAVDSTTGTAAGTPVCVDVVNRDVSAWRYGAYREADGSRVTLNTGFPIHYTDPTTGVTSEGWIGNWGIWMHDGTTIPTGAEIMKFDYATGAETGPYTYTTTGGKLVKHSKVKLTLDDIKNVPVQVNGSCTTDPTTGFWDCPQLEAVWDTTLNQLVYKKKLDSQTWLWKKLDATTTPALDTPVTVDEWQWSFSFWSQALGGSGQVSFERCSQNDVDAVTADLGDDNTINDSVNTTDSIDTTLVGNCTSSGRILGSAVQDPNTYMNVVTPIFQPTTTVAFQKETIVFQGDTANAPAVDLACAENCPSSTNIGEFNAATAAANGITDATYTDTGWNWDPNNPNLSTVNERLAPADWKQCPNKVAVSGSGVNCSPSVPDYNAPSCADNSCAMWQGDPQAGITCSGYDSNWIYQYVSNGAGTTCQGWDANWNWVYPPMATAPAGGYYTYTFDSTAYKLWDNFAGGSAATADTDLSTTAGAWLYSGSLFDPNTTGTFSWQNWDGTTGSGTFEQAIQCDWPFDPNGANWTWDSTTNTGSWSGGSPLYGTCTWKLWQVLDEFWTWESGSDWNTLKTLVDANGVAIKFDEPFILDYVHNGPLMNGSTTVYDNTDATAVASEWDGSRMALQYGGFGDLWGIPGQCVDWDTGAAEDCDMTSRWVPAFTIPDGAGATYTDSTGATQLVYIKALEKEERMRGVDLSSCSGLTLTAYTLPDETGFSAPDIGTMPDATSNPNDPIASGSPSVVGGVVQ